MKNAHDDIHVLKAICKILDGLLTNDDRQLALELMLAPRPGPIVAHAAAACARWAERAQRPEWVRNAISSRYLQVSLPGIDQTPERKSVEIIDRRGDGE